MQKIIESFSDSYSWNCWFSDSTFQNGSNTGRESGGAKVASAFRSQTHSIDFRIVYVGFRIVGGESVGLSEEGGGKVVNLMVLSSKSEFG